MPGRGRLGLSAPVLAKEDKSVSTVTTGQAGKGDKVVSTTQVAPADPVADAVKDRFRQRFSGMDVTAVRRYGLFEVQLGMDLIYTDEK